MMGSFSNTLEILNKIASKSSTKEKQKIIADNEENQFFWRVVYMALDPYKTYKMTGNIKPDIGKLGTGYAGSSYDVPVVDAERISMQIMDKLNEFTRHSGISKREKDDLADLARMAGPEAVEVVNRILDKNLKCGANVLTFKKASPVFWDLPVHHPMKGIADLHKFYEAAGSRTNCCWSIKLDGTRCFACTTPDNITYLSSNGFELQNFHVFDDVMHKAAMRVMDATGWEEVIFDGEVINVQGDFSKHMSQFRRLKDMDASGFRFRIFDVFPKFRPYSKPFAQRYQMLKDCGLTMWPFLGDTEDDSALCAYVVHEPLNKHPKQLVQDAIAQGFEGIMLKTWDGVYEDKRVNYWCKIKSVNTEDLPVVGKVEGTGKYAGTLGSLVVNRNGVKVEVGSGFTDEERREFWANPPKCIEVKYQDALASGSLRFPVFVRVRDDKTGVEDNGNYCNK